MACRAAMRAPPPHRPPPNPPAMRAALYALALCAVAAVATPPHAPPELPAPLDVRLPPRLDLPAPSSLANDLSLSVDEAIELHSQAAVAKNASRAAAVAAVADAKVGTLTTLNATKAALAAHVNASKALFADSVLAPVTGKLLTGGVRGGALLKKANWTDSALLTSELALAKGAAGVKAAAEEAKDRVAAAAGGAKDRLVTVNAAGLKSVVQARADDVKDALEAREEEAKERLAAKEATKSAAAADAVPDLYSSPAYAGSVVSG